MLTPRTHARAWTATLFLTIALFHPRPASAQLDWFFPEGQSFDPAIPSPQAFLGYEIGDFHTRHDLIVDYLKELASLSDRATYQEIGRTYEHRPMPVLTVTAPSNHDRLEAIRQEHLARSTAAPGSDAGTGPAIAHLGFGVHGNETSSAEAALLIAYWLVAGTTSEVEGYLTNGVFHIEPSLNPDGRDRHTHWANMHRAQPFVSDPLDREHNEGWPGGRTNHYWFDLNRDWLPLVNPESKARIDFHHSWRPHLVTDYHEMGTSSTYFFEPSEPIGSWNPLLPEELYTEITVDFADYWAEALDEIGSLYFTKEIYDNSYPGYGSTYPNFLGGLGLVFEQASARGHVQDSRHHGQLTFGFAIRNHLRTAMATVRALVDQKDRMADYQRRYFATALNDSDAYGVAGWVFGDAHDHAKNRAFIDLLLRHRIEVHELAQSRTVDGVTFEPGAAWVVPSRQTFHHLARSVFERTEPESFADSVFYDASAWTVSLAYGMPDGELRGALPSGDPLTQPPAAGSSLVDRSSVAYLLDWRDSGAMRALQTLQAAGVRAEFTMAPFTGRTTRGEVEFARGSVSMPVSIQEISADSLLAAVGGAAREAGVLIHAATTGYSAAGVDLGSRNFRPVRTPRVLMPIGDGLSGYEVGQVWHFLDQQVRMPITKVDVTDIGRVTWSDYDVLILVSGNLSFLAGERLETLEAWIRGGGTLIASRQAAAWAARNGLTPNILAPGVGRPVSEEEPAEGRGRRDYADAAGDGAQAIGGSIWQADLDLTHPLGFGYTRRFLPVWRDHALFFEPSANEYSTVAALVEGDAHLSGYISGPNRERLAGSPSVMADRLGRGTVVLLVDNPNFRGYWRGTQRLLMNAIWFGGEVAVP